MEYDPNELFSRPETTAVTATSTPSLAAFPEQKLLPDPLSRCLSDLGVDPGDALFVGDGEYDAMAALAAETSFLPPSRTVLPDRSA